MTAHPVLMEVIGEELARPLGKGAHTTALLGGRDVPVGSVVTATLTGSGDAQLAAVLAQGGTARAVMVRLAAAHGLSLTHSPETAQEVAAILAAPAIDDPTLLDLTGLPFVTIDGAGARDLDQALHVERSRGGYLVRYAIADASFYVRPGSALFDEAIARGASYYLPGFVAPMLPRELSEGIVSLNAGEERRALILAMQLDATGRCTETKLERARILSRAALSFQEVQELYDHPARSPINGRSFCPSLDLLREVGRLRLVEARHRDVVTYQRAEMEVRLGDAGFGFNVVADVRTEVELYNEQISLVCNVEGAKLLAALGGKAAWRVHPAPPDGRLAELERLIGGIVAEHRLDPAIWRWRRRRTPTDAQGLPLADYLARIRAVPGHERVRLAIERAAMVSNVRSMFEPQPGPHYGIGAPLYARLSAPMRELVGVHTHAIAFAVAGLGGWDPPTLDEDLLARVVDEANRARELQRRLTKAANKVVIDHLLERDLGRPEAHRTWHRGTVMELRPTRAYVQLDDPPIELKVYGEDLGAATDLTRGGAALRLGPRRRLRIGAPIDVQVVSFDERRDRWRFAVRATRDGRPSSAGERGAQPWGRGPGE